jgi:hypothetical protein
MSLGDWGPNPAPSVLFARAARWLAIVSSLAGPAEYAELANAKAVAADRSSVFFREVMFICPFGEWRVKF